MVVESTTAATDSAAGAAAMKKATGMNRDDFLKLFLTQMQNQDPLKPQDGTQFLAQLAQLTQVEQAYNTNSNLQKILDGQSNAAALSAVSFIGKEITAPGAQIVLASGAQPSVDFQLPEAAQSVTIDIRDSAGKAVRTMTLGATPSGIGSTTWDGKDFNGQLVSAGTYTFSVTGTGTSGSSITGTSLIRGRVDAVRLDGSSPVLSMGTQEIPFSSVLQVKGG